MLHTHLSKHFIIVKVNLDNYNGLIDPRKHIKNVRNILESVITKNDVVIVLNVHKVHTSAGCPKQCLRVLTAIPTVG
jgi:uncharacterized protein related to proFAR isomerase